MSDNKMNDVIEASLDGIKEFTDARCSIGDPILTSSGVTVIPVSKVTVGFATGGVDFGQKRLSSAQSFGGGGGSGVTVTPIAFLTVTKDSRIDLIPISNESSSTVGRALSIVEDAPELIKRIKNALT